MKILHVLSTPRAEGTPNLVLDWLRVPGHEQHVFVLHGSPADLSAELRAKAKSYSEDGLFTGRGPTKLMRLVNAVRRVCLKIRPDVVICWPTGLSSWVCEGARLALGWRVRLLVHCGNPPKRGRRNDWISRSVLWPLWLAGAECICCSDYVRDRYRSIPGIPPKLFRTVYNCARAAQIAERVKEIQLSEKRRGDSPAAIMVATMEAHKDHATLLKAMPAVIAKVPGFRLLLIGGGSLRPQLEALARELKVDRAVQFLGSRNDVASWLARSDLFVFSTTEQEGLGSVLIEALAAELPIIASDCPACREILANGLYGKLVPLRDANALAAGIVASLQEKAIHEPRAFISYASSFTPERMMKQYLEAAS